MVAPVAVSHIVMLATPAQRAASRAHVVGLLRNQHLPMPDAESTHLRMDLGQYRLRWEMHTEFVTWTFIRQLDTVLLSGQIPGTASQVVPQEWLAAPPGQCLASMHVWALPSSAQGCDDLVKHVMHEDTLVASTVADGCAEVYTDFAIHADGFSRMLLLTGGISTRRLGRLVQQLLEIETYRMAALMGLPAAREASEVLGNAERDLAELAGAIRSARRDEEPQLLDRLTRLAGQVESQHATSHSRFSASSAYFELVDKRIDDIAESRLAGLQTIREFMDRRLSPARSTCQWATRRQDALSQRVSRISNLLRTRVEIEQQQSSQALSGTFILHIPYRGTALAITSAKRSTLAPDMPTVSEVLPGFESVTWFGIYGPKNMPPDITAKVNQAINAALADSDVKERFARLGAEPAGGTAQAFETMVKADNTKWKKIIADRKISVD